MTNSRENDSILGQFIPLHYHFNMLRDTNRMLAFKSALEKMVPLGGKVVDLGGGTGVLSFFAAQRASKVWCVERNPELVKAATRFRDINPQSAKVEIVECDALNFLPPEPVDVVVCEMLHSALLREKQVQVIRSFQERYQQKFDSLPIFVPEVTFLAVQPVQQSFDFCGYHAPVVAFQDPAVQQKDILELAAPFVYQMVNYGQVLENRYHCNSVITIETSGTLNALRFITKNILAALESEGRTIDWFSQYLIMPLDKPLIVKTGERIRVQFNYEACGRIEDLAATMQVLRAE